MCFQIKLFVKMYFCDHCVADYEYECYYSLSGYAHIEVPPPLKQAQARARTRRINPHIQAGARAVAQEAAEVSHGCSGHDSLARVDSSFPAQPIQIAVVVAIGVVEVGQSRTIPGEQIGASALALARRAGVEPLPK